MADSGLKNKSLLKRITELGSTALKGRNPFGVNVFSGSIEDDGVVSGKLTKTKYNENELVKSVDTNIFELLAPDLPPEPDVVPRPIYNEATQSILDLEDEVERLNVTASNLRALVSDLRIVSQSLRIELDSKELIVAATENQSQQSILQTTSIIGDLQNSIQKATSEVIQRTSLTARNETLKAEVDRLIDRLEGKDAKKTEGYEVSETFAVKVLKTGKEGIGDLVFNSRVNQDGDGTWINGPDILVNNFTENTITVTFKIEGSVDRAFNPPSDVTIAPKTEITVSVTTNKNAIDSKAYRPFRRVGTSKDKLYTGTLVIESSDGGNKGLTLELEKQRGGSFTRS